MLDDVTPRREPAKKQRTRRAKASSISADFTDKGWQEIRHRHLAGLQTTGVVAPTAQVMQAVCDVVESSWGRAHPAPRRRWAYPTTTPRSSAKNYFGGVSDDEVMPAAVELDYVKTRHRETASSPTSAPAVDAPDQEKPYV